MFRRDWKRLALDVSDALARCETKDDLTPYLEELSRLRDACEAEIRDVMAPPEEGFDAGAVAGHDGDQVYPGIHLIAEKVADHTHRGTGL
jgi:hypothetical protein